MIVMINRKDYFQCGYIIRKGSLETHIKPAGLEAFRHDLATLVSFLGVPGPDGKSRADEIQAAVLRILLPRLPAETAVDFFVTSAPFSRP